MKYLNFSALIFICVLLLNTASADSSHREIVRNQFISEANSTSSKLRKWLDKYNEENTDGRNSNGVIEFPIEGKNVVVVELESDFLPNPYRYSRYENDTCYGQSYSGNFVVYLQDVTSGFSGGWSSTSLPFKVELKDEFTFYLKGITEDWECEVHFMENDPDVKHRYIFSDFSPGK